MPVYGGTGACGRPGGGGGWSMPWQGSPLFILLWFKADEMKSQHVVSFYDLSCAWIVLLYDSPNSVYTKGFLR